MVNIKLEVIGVRHIEQNRLGDMGEHYATTWMWDKGYEVFKNSGCTGAIDLIARDNKGNLILIDVKTDCTDSKRGVRRQKNCRTKEQIEMGVQLLRFNPETRKLIFLEHRT